MSAVGVWLLLPGEGFRQQTYRGVGRKRSMAETVLFESERMSELSEVAAYLRTVADKLDAGEPVTLEAGDESVTLDPPGTVEFEVKAEHEGPEGNGELSLELELEWDETSEGSDGSLSIK